MSAATLLACPPCPGWCDGGCLECSCEDNSCRLLHTQQDTCIGGLGRDGKPNTLLVALERQDSPDTVGTVGLHLDLEEHDLHLCVPAARDLAAALLRLCDQAGAA